jgi:hypothetical protein
LNPRVTYGLCALFIIIALVIGVSVLLERDSSASERHDLRYRIELSTNTTIEDVSLFIPVPELNGTPYLTRGIVDRSAGDIPEGWNVYMVVAQESPMLCIRADRMVPEYHGYPVPVESGTMQTMTHQPTATASSPQTPVLRPVSFTVTDSSPSRVIDTRNPVGKEPVFFPEGRFIPTQLSSSSSSGKAFLHRVPVWISFRSAQPAHLSLLVGIEGSNSIWRGGWNSNTYSDTVVIDIVSPTTNQWVEAEGVLMTGSGVYW